MKLMELAAKPDDKTIYRQIAAAAREGDSNGLSAPVDLTPDNDGPANPTSEEDIAKLAGKLRSGLASINDGRYTVEVIGSVAWVSVNKKDVRVRKPKAAPPADSPAPPADFPTGNDLAEAKPAKKKR